MTRTHSRGRPKVSALPAAAKRHPTKYSRKNGAGSTFGPIAVRPRNNKWSLTASMGGTSTNNSPSNQNQKQHSQGKKNNNTGARSGKAKQQQNKWTLQMPVVSSTARPAPWLTPQQAQMASSPSSNKLRKVLPGLSLPVASLEKLQQELMSFAAYVRLSETDIASRLQVVKEVQGQCHHLFGLNLDSVRVFGSFACLDVCTFASDVDLAIHDLVHEPPASSAQQSTKTVDEEATPKRGTKRQKSSVVAVHPNQKRQERILEWKALLDEAEARQQKAAEEQGSNVKPPLPFKSTQAPTLPAAASSSECQSDSNGQESISRRSGVTETDDGDVEPFFVIDTFGCPEELITENPVVLTDSSRESSTLEETVGTLQMERASNESEHSDDSPFVEETGDSDDDSADKLASLYARAGNVDAKEPLQSRSLHGVPHLHEVIEILDDDDGDENDIDDEDQDEDNDEVDDEDDDDGDCDEPLKVETRPRSRSLISLCSATTCSDDEEREWDDSGMQVSFVSNGKSKRTVPELSEETRVKVIRALNALGRRLRGSLPLLHLHVRKKARVPIINIGTRYGYECDIAIGGHQGMDTSGYAVAQCQRFQSFAPVVLVMKILLNQQGLDKPYSGGLGSFKLYVLVASHIEQHLSLGGQDYAAEVLLTFLFRYGRVPDAIRGRLDPRVRTDLGQDTVVTTDGSGVAKGMADMSSVFQLENSIRVFQACYFVLRRKLQKPSSDPLHSILGYLVDAQSLKSERAECRRKVPSYQRSPVGTIPGLPVDWRSNGQHELSTSQSSTRNMLASPSTGRKNSTFGNVDNEGQFLKVTCGKGGASPFRPESRASGPMKAGKKRKR